MSKNDGGPAFPLLNPISPFGPSKAADGMSLRDYLAAKAMQGELANPKSHDAMSAMNLSLTHACALYAQYAYVMADAMLAEREKSK